MRLKSWEFSSMLGLANTSGTWDPGPGTRDPMWTILSGKEHFLELTTIFGEIMGTINQNPNISKSNQLHVTIFCFFVITFEIYFIDFSKLINNFPETLKYNQSFLNLNRFIWNPGGDLEIFIRDGVTKDMVCLILMS